MLQEITHDLLLRYPETERKEISAGLRRFQRRHEIKGFHGPSFDPRFVSLHSSDQHEAGLGFLAEPQEEMSASDLPAFVSMPTVHFGRPGPMSNVPQNAHRPKSLLQYHYRFGHDQLGSDRQGSSDFMASVGQSSVIIREMWCLAANRSMCNVSWPNLFWFKILHWARS